MSYGGRYPVHVFQRFLFFLLLSNPDVQTTSVVKQLILIYFPNDLKQFFYGTNSANMYFGIKFSLPLPSSSHKLFIIIIFVLF